MPQARVKILAFMAIVFRVNALPTSIIDEF